MHIIDGAMLHLAAGAIELQTTSNFIRPGPAWPIHRGVRLAMVAQV